MAKSLSSKARQANQRVIEGKQRAATQGKKERVQASSAPIVKVGLGSRIGEAIAVLYGKASTGLREAIQSLREESVETREQALKELRIHQYKAQCAVVGKEWKQGMVPADFMAKSGTLMFKKQRSLSANYSRAIRIVSALAKGINVAKICEATSLSDMVAYCDKSGSKGDKKKALSQGEFKKYLERLPLVCLDHTKEEQVEHLEKFLMQAMKLAEKHAVALSPTVRDALGIKMETKGRKAA